MRIYVTEKDNVARDENNLVNLQLADGTLYNSLEPRRLFPVSHADEYITLLNTEGVEVAIIKSISALNDESERVIRESLDDYYLVPHIKRIISSEEKYGTLRWTVETERGIKNFDIRNRNHDIKVYPDGRVRASQTLHTKSPARRDIPAGWAFSFQNLVKRYAASLFQMPEICVL